MPITTARTAPPSAARKAGADQADEQNANSSAAPSAHRVTKPVIMAKYPLFSIDLSDPQGGLAKRNPKAPGQRRICLKDAAGSRGGRRSRGERRITLR